MWTVVAFNVVAFVFFAISFVRPLSLERRCEHGCHRGDNSGQHIYEHAEHGGAATVLAGKYTCPMHPEVVSDKPGDCPKCGMALEPMALALPKTIYTCPMHPEIERDHPGDCPICGMRLEPKTVGVEDSAEHTEIRSLSRKFWIGLVFAAASAFHSYGPLDSRFSCRALDSEERFEMG